MYQPRASGSGPLSSSDSWLTAQVLSPGSYPPRPTKLSQVWPWNWAQWGLPVLVRMLTIQLQDEGLEGSVWALRGCTCPGKEGHGPVCSKAPATIQAQGSQGLTLIGGVTCMPRVSLNIILGHMGEDFLKMRPKFEIPPLLFSLAGSVAAYVRTQPPSMSVNPGQTARSLLSHLQWRQHWKNICFLAPAEARPDTRDNYL